MTINKQQHEHMQESHGVTQSAVELFEKASLACEEALINVMTFLG